MVNSIYLMNVLCLILDTCGQLVRYTGCVGCDNNVVPTPGCIIEWRAVDFRTRKREM